MRAGAETTLACSSEPNPLRAKAKRNALPALRNLRTAGAAPRNWDKPNVLRTEITTKRTTHPLEAQGTKNATYLS